MHWCGWVYFVLAPICFGHPSCLLNPPLFFTEFAPCPVALHAHSHTHSISLLLSPKFPSLLPCTSLHPHSLPSPVGNPAQCDCGCPSWKLWWWLWLLHAGARIVPASLCVSVLCVVCMPECVSVCVYVYVCAYTLHKHSTTTLSVGPTAGRHHTRATPSPRFSPDASPEYSHYTNTYTHTTMHTA